MAPSVSSKTKAEDRSLHTYHFTIRDSTTTAQILPNNFWKTPKELEKVFFFFQAIVEYRPVTIKATTDIF